eukprot:TRINITY_DN800_c0_g2_i1.p1 TRINITY_DN800_c0_g2~~TRINITY_DN800_c0_g2_i1.p1  ORF type:complete len:450 (+),score=131.28 TRINITY_DN800_c0_g2_i1:140-1351(+)
MCHPDKNGHRQEAAAKDFKELSNAYTTLMDKNERAWYDAHKEQILSGRTHDDDYEPNSMDLFPYFSPNAFNGFDINDPKSFYNVYDKVFKTLSEEEIPFLDKKEKAAWKPPSIGNPTTPIEDVNYFYDFWKSHQTSKNFSWKDKYNPNDAENRQIRRAIEKENKKERSAAKREYNETLRNLVIHVKKNDKRVKEHRIKLAQKQEEERLAKEAHQKKVVEERKRNFEESKASWWEEFENEFDFDENADTLQAVMEANMTEKQKQKLRKKKDEDEIDNFYCKVCKKVFRSKPKLMEHKERRSTFKCGRSSDTFIRTLNLNLKKKKKKRKRKKRKKPTPNPNLQKEKMILKLKKKRKMKLSITKTRKVTKKMTNMTLTLIQAKRKKKHQKNHRRNQKNLPKKKFNR